MTLREDAASIIRKSLESVMPDHAVRQALSSFTPGPGKLILIAVGKAAWCMADAAVKELGDRIDDGICITKYGHVRNPLPFISCMEAGHPVPDQNSIDATKKAEKLVSGLTSDDTVLLLLSGGGSALFEDPLIPLNELQTLTDKLLACGADITQINTIRKRLSNIKGGKFAKICEPAHVFSIVLSDILGNPLDMIAGGPAFPDNSTCEEAFRILHKYHIEVSPTVETLLHIEPPKDITNVTTQITGSVKSLCQSAVEEASRLGYETHFLTSSLCCTARDAGSFLSSIANEHAYDNKNLAYICGGETVVRVTGNGLGGRNQEIALSCADGIEGLTNCAVFSFGSDGTDGPTDAAGGYCDGNTKRLLEAKGVRIQDVLDENDAYHALERCDGLILTGPTGTNVNDVTVLLIRNAKTY